MFERVIGLENSLNYKILGKPNQFSFELIPRRQPISTQTPHESFPGIIEKDDPPIQLFIDGLRWKTGSEFKNWRQNKTIFNLKIQKYHYSTRKKYNNICSTHLQMQRICSSSENCSSKSSVFFSLLGGKKFKLNSN